MHLFKGILEIILFQVEKEDETAEDRIKSHMAGFPK